MTGAHTADSSSGEAGFTLVELLIALVLLSLISTSLFGGLRFGFKVWQQGNARADNGEAVIVTQNFLRRAIGEAYPLFVADQPRGGHVDFLGAKDSIEFLSSAPVAFDHSGRLRFRLFVDRQTRRNEVVTTARAELADPNGPSTTKRVLLDDVKSIEFAYFGRGRADPAAGWRENWIGEVALPQLVRIRVAFAEEARAWPELTIAPRIEADEACTYDVLTKRCQGR